MGSTGQDGVLEVVPPPRPSRLTGVRMAGFRQRGSAPLDMRAIPHPAVTLALDAGSGAIVVDGPTSRRRGSVVAGLAFDPVRVGGPAIEAVQVRLSPLVAYRVLGTSPADLAGAVVALDDLWGREATRIQERLRETRSWPERFALAEDLVARRSQAGRPGCPEVAWAWERIVRSRGRVRVEALAAELGWGRKRLWSRFRAHIGIAPNRAAKLLRFDDAAHRLAAGLGPARAAAESGFFDQAHLHRDVRAFAGVTPAVLAAEPFLAVDDVAWPAAATRSGPRGALPGSRAVR
jgi:AraC-like DNA-binding protein